MKLDFKRDAKGISRGIDILDIEVSQLVLIKIALEKTVKDHKGVQEEAKIRIKELLELEIKTDEDLERIDILKKSLEYYEQEINQIEAILQVLT